LGLGVWPPPPNPPTPNPQSPIPNGIKEIKLNIIFSLKILKNLVYLFD